MMINYGPFRIPEKCKDCLSVAACLEDFEKEDAQFIDEFKTKMGDFLEAEEIYAGNLLTNPPDEAAREYFRGNWEATTRKIANYTLQTQAIFDDIEAKCPGMTPDRDCNYPES